MWPVFNISIVTDVNWTLPVENNLGTFAKCFGIFCRGSTQKRLSMKRKEEKRKKTSRKIRLLKNLDIISECCGVFNTYYNNAFLLHPLFAKLVRIMFQLCCYTDKINSIKSTRELHKRYYFNKYIYFSFLSSIVLFFFFA